jgi:hypothetical protein
MTDGEFEGKNGLVVPINVTFDPTGPSTSTTASIYNPTKTSHQPIWDDLKKGECRQIFLDPPSSSRLQNYPYTSQYIQQTWRQDKVTDDPNQCFAPGTSVLEAGQCVCADGFWYHSNQFFVDQAKSERYQHCAFKPHTGSPSSAQGGFECKQYEAINGRLPPEIEEENLIPPWRCTDINPCNPPCAHGACVLKLGTCKCPDIWAGPTCSDSAYVCQDGICVRGPSDNTKAQCEDTCHKPSTHNYLYLYIVIAIIAFLFLPPLIYVIYKKHKAKKAKKI